MREPSRIRVVSLALALSVVIDGWALFEYGNRPSPPITATLERSELAAATKDSELRQPHSAQKGDYLTGERKKLYDERFSLGR